MAKQATKNIIHYHKDGTVWGKGKMLGENVWLIPLSNGLPTLTSLLQDAQSNGFAYKVLFLSEEPAWSKFMPPKKDE